MFEKGLPLLRKGYGAQQEAKEEEIMMDIKIHLINGENVIHNNVEADMDRLEKSIIAHQTVTISSNGNKAFLYMTRNIVFVEEL